ncbi:GNAT family N-acetyltransferase [Pseudomonas sp. B21-053]|uniref:GNAT family N-acetyltransferase n=1 Tax=Pseudomonas sp. B21-053 TaxID=2895493 RepID=UPI0029FF2F8A|nr:GNAT family N-acetyltransferase [Pseudomonas sp. B21-053]
MTGARQHLHAIETQDIWVAELPDGVLAGFLSAEQVDNQLHIQELSVSQPFQGQGIGRKLLLAAIEYSRERELDGLTLTTFRDVPWNAPFYQRSGFETLSAAETSPRLLAILRQEIDHGLPEERRCAMWLRLL